MPHESSRSGQNPSSGATRPTPTAAPSVARSRNGDGGRGEGGERRRRLLVVASTLGGGTGGHLMNRLAALSSSGWDVRILTHDPFAMSPPPGVDLVDDSEGRRGAGFPIAQWRQLRRLARLVREIEPDVVHTYFFWPIVYGRLLRRAGLIRRLVENREDEGFAWSRTDYGVLRATASVPDRIICVSESVRAIALSREGAPPGRTTTIRNGIPLPRRETAGGRRTDLRRELGIEEGQPVVGLVAHLNRAVKGVDRFVAAIPSVLARVPRARFVVVGDGPDRPKLEAQARRLGVADHVVFAGLRSDVAPFYRLMDVSVLSSLSEGLSITLLESMSFGVPVVATRVGGNPEVVADGITGRLVPPDDPAALGRAIAALLRNPAERREMGVRARRRVEREFSMSIVSGRYEQMYDQLLHPVPESARSG